MAYEPQTWADGVEGGTPITAAALTHIETGIADAADAADAPVAWGDVSGKPATFPLTIGTTATTAKAGNYAPAWGDVTGKPAVIAAGADAAAARTAIGAGTSSLQIGTTASTAKAGNAVQTATQTTATAVGTGTATNVQGILEELAARITALEEV